MDPEARTKQLSDQAAMILDLAKKLGAQRAAVFASYGLSSRIQYEKNDFNLAASHEASGFGITVHWQNRSGSASINSMDQDSIAKTVGLAMAMARHCVPDEFLAMASPASYTRLPSTFDPRTVGLGMREIRELAESLIGEATRDSRISLDNAEVERSAGVRVIANSNGVLATDAGSSLSWSLMGMAIEGKEVTSFDHSAGFTYFADGREEKAQATARELSARLLACLGAKPGKSYKGAVLLPPCVAEEILVDPIVYHMLGSSIMDGKSRLAGSLGKKIAHENLSFSDKPHDLRLRGCTSFSGEGVPTTEMPLVERGVLKRHLDTVYSASRRKTKPTGNGGGPHCLDLRAGTTPLDELRKKESMLVEVGRFSGSIDCVTGDFSGVAKGSSLYRKGVRQGPLKEMMIAGNAFHSLGQELFFSSERRDDGGSYWVPYALVRDISVTAG